MILQDLDAKTYHADIATISKHGLDLIAQAPAKYHYQKTQGGTKQTDSMRWGSLVHLAVLEPDKFDSETIAAPEKTRASKEGKAAWEEAEASGKLIVKVGEREELDAIKAAISSHPAAATLLSGDIGVEHSVFWTDEESGMACRCRPDVIRCDGIIVDLKTTQDASFAEFSKNIANFRYHVQAAMYTDGLRANGVQAESFVFLCVEKEAPYLVQCFVCDDQMIDIGRTLYKRDLQTYKRCLQTNQWDAYSPAIVPISLPFWAVPKETNL
jgi:hypothetical protein